MDGHLDCVIYFALLVSCFFLLNPSAQAETKVKPSTYTSSVYTTTYDQLIHEFSTSKEVATLGLSLYVLGLGLGPMLLAPLPSFLVEGRSTSPLGLVL
jgi:hypothetical protein